MTPVLSWQTEERQQRIVVFLQALHRLMASSSSGTTNDKVFRIVWWLTGKIFAGTPPTMSEYQSLKDAIHPPANYEDGSRKI